MVRFQQGEKIYDRSSNIEQIYRFRKFLPNKRGKERGNGNVI